MLDSTRQRETPEGIDLSFAPAGPLVRGAAWGIDFLIRIVIYIAAISVLSMLGQAGVGLYLIVLFSVEWLYPIVFEARNGQTPGKKQMGIRVINEDGTQPGWQPCMVRNLIRFVDFLPFFYGFGLISVFLNRDFKRLGDFAAGTLVIHDPRKVKQRVESETIKTQALALNLTLKEQQAVIQFSERQHMLTESRKAELVSILAPLIASTNDIDNDNEASRNALVQKILAYANWLSGKSI